MSGHSHWATIKRKKGAADQKRGAMFSKLAKAISLAARTGGGDPDTNIQLKYAIDKAKQSLMPRDNIDRAVKKGTGELTDSAALETVKYEAIGPAGVFILIDCLTDNRNRTASEVRKILELRNARLGSVAWAFEPKGMVTLPAEGVNEDQLTELVLDAGAEDLQRSGNVFQVTTAPGDLEAVRRALTEKGVKIESAELTQLAKTPQPVDAEVARKLVDLMGELEDHEDVQGVFSNMELSEAVMAEMSKN
jgi:YebC/PmpR family DNA-binding regulatory protein